MSAAESARDATGGGEYPPIVQLIPHREPMILLDELVAWSPGSSRCLLTVSEEARLVTDGVLETPLLIEHMAQAVAVCLGYEAFRGGRGVRVGMIVGCRSFECVVPALRAGEQVHVTARQRSANYAVSGFECAVERIPATGAGTGGQLVAKAHLTLYHGDTINAGMAPGD